MAPKLVASLGIRIVDKKVYEFFIDIIKKTIENRRKAGTTRNDIIDLFIDIIEKDKPEELFDKDELMLGFVATSLLFFFAGFDTNSTTMGVIVHALMHHQEIQERVREEISEVLGDDGEVEAEHLRDMKFTERVILESMRKYFMMGRKAYMFLFYSNYLYLLSYIKRVQQRLQNTRNRSRDTKRNAY